MKDRLYKAFLTLLVMPIILIATIAYFICGCIAIILSPIIVLFNPQSAFEDDRRN